MLVRAKELGFFNGALVYPGQEFEVDKKTKGKWFEPVKNEPEKAKQEPKE